MIPPAFAYRASARHADAFMTAQPRRSP